MRMILNIGHSVFFSVIFLTFVVCNIANAQSTTIEKINLQLVDAAAYGNLKKVKFLIEEDGVDINSRDDLGDTALHQSAKGGNIRIIKYLVEKKADLNIKNNDGKSPLHYAVSEANFEAVKYLVENGADINTQNKFGNTPLHNATFSGYLAIVKYLLEKGAKVNEKNKTRPNAAKIRFAKRSNVRRKPDRK
jgi:ankyrin repeat protein